MSTISRRVQPTISIDRPAAVSRVKRFPLASYLVFAFGFSWLVWIPFLVLSQNGLGLVPIKPPVVPLVVLGGFGPALAAVVATAKIEGRAGVMHLLRQCVQWRVGIQWYLFVVFAYPVAFLVVSIFLGKMSPSSVVENGALLFTLYPLALVAGVFVGGLGEEPGWRGFALPRMQRRFGPVIASVILGAVWAGWHIPLFLVHELSQSNFSFGLFLLAGICLSLIMTWVYNNTRGSLLIMMVLHEAQDATAALSLHIAPAYLNRTLAYVIAFGSIALLVLAFSRGGLSYPSPDGMAAEPTSSQERLT